MLEMPCATDAMLTASTLKQNTAAVESSVATNPNETKLTASLESAIGETEAEAEVERKFIIMCLPFR